MYRPSVGEVLRNLNTLACLTSLDAPLYLRTLWRYTNAVIIIIIIIIVSTVLGRRSTRVQSSKRTMFPSAANRNDKAVSVAGIAELGTKASSR